ncbi:MAG: PilZ domain-containing protein, partial [Myxococcota bacterium]
MVDDGELDDVRDILADLGAEFALLRGGAIPDELAPPSLLFVATPRRAMLAQEWKKLKDAPSPMCVGIVAEDSNTLRSMLRRLGFQLLIRRPVNPYALRLLLLRTLYAGEERRTDDRVPIGAPVAYRSGLRRRSGTIAELSRRGGRLLTDAPLPSGSRITLQLSVPGSDRSLSLRARCIRASEEPVVGDQYAVALSFEETDRAADLQRLLQHYKSGPAQLAAEFEAELNDDTEGRLPLAAPSSDAERRKHERVVFRREVIGLSEEAATVLMGHDLSIGGMRVEGTPDLEVGKRVRLAVFGAPREEPILVRAIVTRAEDGGYGLQFVDVGAASGSRLEHLVAHLPSVESLEGDETEGLGTVVTRIVSRDD